MMKSNFKREQNIKKSLKVGRAKYELSIAEVNDMVYHNDNFGLKGLVVEYYAWGSYRPYVLYEIFLNKAETEFLFKMHSINKWSNKIITSKIEKMRIPHNKNKDDLKYIAWNKNEDTNIDHYYTIVP